MDILSLLLWTPALGVLFLVFTPAQKTQLIRLISLAFASLDFILSCWLLSRYDSHTASLQFKEYFPLNPDLGSAYALGVDGLSMPMLMLATLLTCIALLASLSLIHI